MFEQRFFLTNYSKGNPCCSIIINIKYRKKSCTKDSNRSRKQKLAVQVDDTLEENKDNIVV
jgi:hypothetical protein